MKRGKWTIYNHTLPVLTVFGHWVIRLTQMQKNNNARHVHFNVRMAGENKNRSTVFRLESVESALSRRKSAKGDKGRRMNNYLTDLIILTRYDIIDENNDRGE